MPSYDLVCQACVHKFEVFCSISQKDHQKCPECGSDKIKQRLTTVNVVGKSSGGNRGSGVAKAVPSRFG
jgi:putative FmdB family regulatory protein